MNASASNSNGSRSKAWLFAVDSNWSGKSSSRGGVWHCVLTRYSTACISIHLWQGWVACNMDALYYMTMKLFFFDRKHHATLITICKHECF